MYLSVKGILDHLYINGWYDVRFDTFFFLDGTPVPTEIMDMRDPADPDGKGCMGWYNNMLWRDKVCTKSLGFICQRNVTGRA